MTGNLGLFISIFVYFQIDIFITFIRQTKMQFYIQAAVKPVASVLLW